MAIGDKISSVAANRDRNFCHDCQHFDYDEDWDGEDERGFCYCSEHCCMVYWHDIACDDYVEAVI